ncbi:hypothetical protein MKZ38_000032 [Zalerion maritima]|uniref:Cytochrome b5 heme-binding domain-containing protein n=1 Tax=Zalerion maritima TaxID=339359 RepID=A0AAD5WSS9_9PEZI|nr:hypothetical protein MKZ38_000032 [Zalerion maritima]
MAVIGLSLILASVVYLIVRPPPWFATYFLSWRQPQIEGPAPNISDKISPWREGGRADGRRSTSLAPGTKSSKEDRDKVAMPPPPVTAASDIVVLEEKQHGKKGMPPPPVIAAPSISTPKKKKSATLPMPPPPIPQPLQVSSPEPPGEQTTPKAGATNISTLVPSFNLEEPTSTSTSSPKPATSASPAASTLMPPPSRPLPRAKPPTLSRFPSGSGTSSSSSLTPGLGPAGPAPPRGSYVPARGPGTSTLAPPPTHTSIPTKSRQVTLQPGRSPLDWARISSGPTADLRNLPPSTPYLKITRSQLKQMSGRKGTDVWMALNGKVYNIEPYKEYHPGGIGELLRGSGKDGTKLFGEVHPWVNYETMLQACLVGVLVEENDVKGSMDEMD